MSTTLFPWSVGTVGTVGTGTQRRSGESGEIDWPGSARLFTVRLGAVGLGAGRPHHSVYVRRRLMVALVFVGLLAVIGVSARTVLADRGGVPASTPAIRPATVPPAAAESVAGAATAQPLTQSSTQPSTQPSTQLGTPPPAAAGAVQYVVQPGDTLWSLAELFHGQRHVSSYVEAMVDANGGASLQVGQLLTLP